MNHDPRKAIRQAMMIARRQAAYGGQQSYPGYMPINPLTGLPDNEAQDGSNDPGTPGPPGAPSTGDFGKDVAGFAEAAGPALGGMAIGGLMGGPAGAVMGGVASTMAQGLAEALGLSAPASAPPGGFASVAGNVAQTQMGMTPTSNPAAAFGAALTGPAAPADQEDADQGKAEAAAQAAADAATSADNTNSMSMAATTDAAADSDGGTNGDSGGAGGNGGGDGFARGGDVKGSMDPAPITAYHTTYEPFEEYDWSKLGEGTAVNSTDDDPDSWAMTLARIGPWAHQYPLNKQMGYGVSMPVSISGKGKAFDSLDSLHAAVKKTGGVESFRKLLLAKGFEHVAVKDEEFGKNKSYVALHPGAFSVKRGGDGFARGGDVKGSMDPRSLPGIHLRTNHRFADGGPVQPPQDENVRIDDPIIGYHGTPHKFDSFDPSKIGTGEGTQFEGHGMYLAEKENVAQWYRDNLISPYVKRAQEESLIGLPYELQSKAHWLLHNQKATPELTAQILSNTKDAEHLGQDKLLDFLNEAKKTTLPTGHMYEVAIHAKPEDFLDWDKPLSEQHPNIISKLKNAVNANKNLENYLSNLEKYTGADVVRLKNLVPISLVEDAVREKIKAAPSSNLYYKNRQAALNNPLEYVDDYTLSKVLLAYGISPNSTEKTINGQQYFEGNFSKAIEAAGIPGVRYLDAFSRKEPLIGSSNYVVFHPKHLEIKRRYAEGGEITPPRDLGADPAVQRAMDATAPFSVSNPMAVFPKPQRMWEGQRPGGAYLSMPAKEDITGHKAAQAEIGVQPGGKPYFNVSKDAIEQTGSPGRGSATVKTNLFKQKAGWKWSQAPEGHENTSTLVSVEHRGKHHYALNTQFPKGVDLARYEDAPSEPRLRPTTKGNVELGEQVGTILVRGKEHPVYRNVIVRNAGGAVGYDDGGRIGNDPTVQQALDITQQVQPTAPQMARQVITQSPKLAATFQTENRPSVIVSPRPGKVGGPPVQREAPEGMPEGFMQEEREPWSFATPNIIGSSQPPPIQHPVFNEPRMEKITNATKQIFKNKDFHGLVRDLTGLQGLTIKPTVGTWKNEMEPSFILSHPDMTDDHAKTLAHLLGFGFQQDATVQVKHNPETEEGIPAMLAGSGKKLTPEQVDAIHREATKHGMDFTITGDGKAAKFLHFGDEEDLPNFMGKVQSISNVANIPELYTARTAGDLIDAQAYLNGIFRGAGGKDGDQTGAGRSPDLFRRVVDHVLAPYAKAVAGEGYRLSPERLAQTHALTDEEREHVRGALYPGKKDDRTTIPLMTGEEQLDVRPTGERGRASVGDVLYALQNRAAAKGQIDPGDFSDNAKKDIAQNIANEVAYHVQNSEKSAIGWYDDALKGAMSQYAGRFPELETDPQKRMLFHAILGITSQGNDVYSNSIHAMRLYDQIQNGGKSLPEAVGNLKGSFGDKTRAIETNLLKLHHLLDNNGYARMSNLFNQTKTVGEWNKILREDKSLLGPGNDQLKMRGGSGQKVTGWMVFGPKIGSFINNLHGDYSTLTADLWFSRTWNRLLGHNFIHTPLAEAKQYRDFRDALRAEYYSSNPNVGVSPIPKTEDGKLVYDKKGRPEPWEYGSDTPALGKEEFDDLLNDPDKMLNFAQDITKRYRDSQFKEKSDLRRRAKNWVENRELPVAAPRGDLERQFQQDTVEEAQRLLKKKHGMNISVADIQAALWFHEKELFGKLGVASEKAQPADYADAARRTNQLIDSGELYRVKSKEKAKKVKPQEEFASGGMTLPMRDSSIIDRALRLTSSNRPMFALADLFQRQLRGRP